MSVDPVSGAAPEASSSQTAGQRLEANLASTAAESPAPAAPVSATPSAVEGGVGGSASSDTGSVPPATAHAASAGTPAVASQPQPPGFLDRLKSLGFQDVSDEQTAREKLIEAYQAQRERQERIAAEYESMRMLSQYGQQFLQLAQDDAFRQFMSQRQAGGSQPQAQPAAEAQAESAKWWSPPEVDELLVREFQEARVDPETKAVTQAWKAETPAEIKDAWQKRQLYYRQWLNKLATNPIEALQPLLKQHADEVRRSVIEEITQQSQQAYSQQREQAVLGQIMQKHASELIQLDPATRQPMRDLLGNYIHTPLGKQVLEAVNELAPVIPDTERLFEAAYNRAVVQRQQAEVAALKQQLEALQAAQQQRQAVVARGATPPNRTGAEPTPAAPRAVKDRHLRPGDRLRETARRAGVSLEPV